jgi:hypothetical protein
MIDPDPGGPKTSGCGGSESGTLPASNVKNRKLLEKGFQSGSSNTHIDKTEELNVKNQELFERVSDPRNTHNDSEPALDTTVAGNCIYCS